VSEPSGSEQTLRDVSTPLAVSDGALPLSAARARDEEFERFFVLEFPRLSGYCGRLLEDRDLGAEVAQEALVRTWARWVRVDSPGSYAFLVATNLVRREWRRRARERPLVSDHSPAAPESDDLLVAVVRDLPLRLREPLILHYVVGMPLREIADALHRPVGTIKRRLHEARKAAAHAYRSADELI
jgi:RNA polymerase sigma-70 factor, ECF subfamily